MNMPADLPRAFVVKAEDNVATMLDDLPAAGAVRLVGAATDGTIAVVEPVKLGHKIALRALPPQEPIIKYGVPIGHASTAIAAGAWVHLHNLASNVDTRSQTLDLHTGSATDTRYA